MGTVQTVQWVSKPETLLQDTVITPETGGSAGTRTQGHLIKREML